MYLHTPFVSINTNNIATKDAIDILDDSLEEQRQEIEKFNQKIDERKVALSTSATQRNSLVPVLSLPPEILGDIFALAQVREPDYGATGGRLRDRLIGLNAKDLLRWISVTHVCRRWRYIAINLATLWVNLPIDYPEWVEEMIRRSKDCSLIVQAVVYGPHQTPNKQVKIQPGLITAMAHIDRIKVLALRFAGPGTWHALKRLVSKSFHSAPRLEQFYLDYSYSESSINDDDHTDISEDILSSIGLLRRLELAHCSIDWNSHPLLRCSLTHLSLIFLSDECMPTAKIFVNVLRSMTTFQALEMHMSLPDIDDWDSETLHLPHLQSLHMEAPNEDLIGFFRHVTFSPACAVKIIFLDEFDHVESFARSYSNASPDIIFRTLALQFSSSHGHRFQLKLFTQDVNDYLSDDKLFSQGAHLELEFPYHASHSGSWNFISEEVIPHIFDCEIDLDDIQYVYIPSTLPMFSSEKLAETLGMLPSLHAIMGKGLGVQTLLNAMRVTQDPQAVISSSPSTAEAVIQTIYFPHVTTMFFQGVTFVEQHELQAQSTNKFVRASFTDLQDLLVERREHGARIGRLVFRECNGYSGENLELLI